MHFFFIRSIWFRVFPSLCIGQEKQSAMIANWTEYCPTPLYTLVIELHKETETLHIIYSPVAFQHLGIESG